MGAPFGDEELTERDHFLTARFRLYTMFGDKLGYAQVEHPRWPLCRARAVKIDQDLIQAAGLPAPEGDPLVHYSPGVDVKVGMPVIL